MFENHREKLAHGEIIKTQKITISKGKLSKEEREKIILQMAMEIIQKFQEDDLEKYGFIKGKYMFKEANLYKWDGYTYEYNLIFGYRFYLDRPNSMQNLKNEER